MSKITDAKAFSVSSDRESYSLWHVMYQVTRAMALTGAVALVLAKAFAPEHVVDAVVYVAIFGTIALVARTLRRAAAHRFNKGLDTILGTSSEPV
jgi:hypothetical protein